MVSVCGVAFATAMRADVVRYVEPKCGIEPKIQRPATGFFQVCQADDGSWWFVNPLGHAMVALGLEHVRMDGFADGAGKRPILEANLKKYGNETNWAAVASARVGEWGFNFLGSGTAEGVKRRNAAHTAIVPLGAMLCYPHLWKDDPERWILPGGGTPCKAMPNVFHPKFAEAFEKTAREWCSSQADDPWFVGWYADNELAWWGGRWDTGRTGLFKDVAALPPAHSARQALEAFMKERGRAVSAATEADKAAFVGLVADRYYATARAAIRKADPNHLFLGSRCAASEHTPDEVFVAMGRHCDVVTLNVYPWADLERNVVRNDASVGSLSLADQLERVHRLSGRPVLVTEFSFSSLDSGLPCDRGVGVRYLSEGDRAKATELCARTLLGLPFSLGYDFFMYPDEPSTPSSHENMNYGLVSVGDRPYPLMTEMFARLNREAVRWRRAGVPSPQSVAGVTADEHKRRRYQYDYCVDAPKFSRTGDVWRVTSGGGYSLSGRVGAVELVSSFRANGRELGSLGALASVWEGPGREFCDVRWPSFARVADVAWRTEGGLGILTLVAESQPIAGPTRWTFRLTLRPEHPETMVELVKVENVGKKAVELRELFLMPVTAWKDDSANWKRETKNYQHEKTDSWRSGSFRWTGWTEAPTANRVEFFARKNADGTRRFCGEATFAFPSIRYRLAPGEAYDPQGRTWLSLELTSDIPDAETLTGRELWGGRKAHLAVVNSPVESDRAFTLSLSGDWETWIGNQLTGRHGWNGLQFYRGEGGFHRTVRVPGGWEAQGVGEPGMGDGWDIKSDTSPKPLRHVHLGAVNYRRRVTVPAAWKGRRVWLKVGEVSPSAWCFVNGNNVAMIESYCGTYKYDITEFVEPGREAVIGLQLLGRAPSRHGEARSAHRWGGILRDVELEATPMTCIDDAWVRGDFDGRAAEVHVGIEGMREEGRGKRDVGRGKRDEGRGMRLRVTVEGETVEQAIEQSNNPNNQTILRVPLRNFRPWSPEHPNLYTATVELVENGQVVQARRERFGVRKLEVKGREFRLNGRPYYLRGFGDDHVYPLTGVSPADREAHRAHLRKARAAGFNFVRLHTHCEIPEYFEAADECGILIQAELPYYADQPCESFSFDPVRDARELWENFRRHPSFAVYSLGNEGTFGDRLDRYLHQYIKKMDPDRLKINQDSHLQNVNLPDRADYTGGPIDMWPRGSFDPDRPFVTHEYMNLGAKSDSRLEPKFTGLWLPSVTRKARADWLAKSGLGLEWGDRLQDSQHALQRVYQKLGIECARTDPYCDGFCFWTIADVVVANQGTFSAQGVFDAFWEPKRCGNGFEDIRVYNSPVGVFADMGVSNRVFTAGDRADVEFFLANYGDGPIAGAALKWRLTAGTDTLAEGSSAIGDQPVGAVRTVARKGIVMPAVKQPTAARFTVVVCGAGGSSVATNDWACWIFPERKVRDGRFIAASPSVAKALESRYSGLLPPARAAEAEVVIAEYGSSLAKEALARGQRVITLEGCEGPTNAKPGWWFFGDQVGTAFLKHPALSGLPHGGFLDELFFRILKKGRELPLAGVAERDLIAVGEGGKNCFAYLAESRQGGGRALMAFGLDVLGGTPEGTSFLDGMIDYVRSSDGK